MITSITPITSVSDQLKLAAGVGIRAAFPSPVREGLIDGQVRPGQVTPILIPQGAPVFAEGKWGVSSLKSPKRVDFANANGQNFGYRGLLLASSFRMITRDGKQIDVSCPDGVLKIGVTFVPGGHDGPLSFKVLLCSAGPELSPYVDYQPVLIKDRYCIDFLNPQKSTIALQTAEQAPSLSVALLKNGAARGDVPNAMAEFERDPNYSERPAFLMPRGLFLLK